MCVHTVLSFVFQLKIGGYVYCTKLYVVAATVIAPNAHGTHRTCTHLHTYKQETEVKRLWNEIRTVFRETQVLKRNTNFSWEKDGFGRKNQLFPGKKMVLGRKTNCFLGKTKKPPLRHFF